MSETSTLTVNEAQENLTLSTLMSEVSKKPSHSTRSELNVKSGDISGITRAAPVSVGDMVRSVN